MSNDTQRAHTILLAVLEAADPREQAAILERECASNGELRQRVEALLKAHREPATVVAPREGAAPPTVGSVSYGLSTDPDRPPSRPPSPRHELVTEHAGQSADEEPLRLDFLQPSSRPGALGRLNQHEVLEVLGKGGFGIVVRAFDETLQRVVAIKVLSPELASTSPARKRFLREARASARVRHENVVHIYAVEERPLPYLVMEYIPGQTLQQRIDQTGPLEVTDVLRIGSQIARGLAAAHEQGLIHRDIKPGNILLESGVEQKVKITDFGLARAADDASLSQSGVIAGTPMYMAPEQAKGDPPDPRADLFSLGSVLYTMVSGRPPFRAANTMAVLKRVAEDTPRPIRQIIPEVPKWLCDVISKLHAKEPSHRFQSAAEVAALLEQYLGHLQQPTLVARPDSVRLPREGGRKRTALLAGSAAVVSLLALSVAYLLWRASGPSSDPLGAVGKDAGTRQPKTDSAAALTSAAATPLRTYVLQGRSAVRDALIDFSEPDRGFGSSARENALRRADQCNAFLVRFDLAKLDLPAHARVATATASFYVWDPSSAGKTKVCAFPLTTEWAEVSATWREPAVHKSWKGGQGFAFGADAGPAGNAVVVEPEKGEDTADPPIEYRLDVTDLVRSWLGGEVPNLGLAIAPAIDSSVDGGIQSRFQVYGSEHTQTQYTPKLTVQAEN
jgi:serine/threonine protein kinase